MTRHLQRKKWDGRGIKGNSELQEEQNSEVKEIRRGLEDSFE